MQILIMLGAMALALLVIVVTGLVIYAIFLGIALGFVNGKNRDLGTTFWTAFLMAIVAWIPILNCLLHWYFIKSRHELSWGSAIVAWIILIVIQIVALMVISTFFLPGLFASMPLIGGMFGS